MTYIASLLAVNKEKLPPFAKSRRVAIGIDMALAACLITFSILTSVAIQGHLGAFNTLGQLGPGGISFFALLGTTFFITDLLVLNYNKYHRTTLKEAAVKESLPLGKNPLQAAIEVPLAQPPIKSIASRSLWENLPKDVAGPISSYLPVSDLVNSLKVCRSWRYVFDAPSCWQVKLKRPSLYPKLDYVDEQGFLLTSLIKKTKIEWRYKSFFKIQSDSFGTKIDDFYFICRENEINVWEVSSRSFLFKLEGVLGQDAFRSVALYKNLLFAHSSIGSHIKIWDLVNKKCIGFLPDFNAADVSTLFIYGDELIGVGGGVIKIWHIPTQTCVSTLEVNPNLIGVRSNGKYIVTATSYRINIYDVTQRKLVKNFNSDFPIRDLAVKGNCLAISTYWTKVPLWDIETGKLLAIYKMGLVKKIFFFKNLFLIIKDSGRGERIYMWDMKTKKCIQKISCPFKWGRTLFSSLEGNVLWNSDSGLSSFYPVIVSS